MNKQPKISTTVVKAFTILELLGTNSAGLSLAEVAGHLRVSKSTAHRYLTTMEELGVVQRDEKDCFGLGSKMIELAGGLLSRHGLRIEGELMLEQLCAQTLETAHLAVPSGNTVVYIAKVDSPLSIRMASHVGVRNPLHCTALGKAVLAHYPPDKVEAIIREGLPSRTEYTLSSAEALITDLERIRQTGFAIDDQENELGVRCAGAPVFDYTGKVVGAISVSGPASRISRERCLELGALVSAAAQEVSRRMGHQTQTRAKR